MEKVAQLSTQIKQHRKPLSHSKYKQITFFIVLNQSSVVYPFFYSLRRRVDTQYKKVSKKILDTMNKQGAKSHEWFGQTPLTRA